MSDEKKKQPERLSRGDRLGIAFTKMAQRDMAVSALQSGQRVNVQKGPLGVTRPLTVEDVIQLGEEAAAIYAELALEAVLDALYRPGPRSDQLFKVIADRLLESPVFIAGLARSFVPAIANTISVPVGRSDMVAHSGGRLPVCDTVSNGGSEADKTTDIEPSVASVWPTTVSGEDDEPLDGPDPRSIDSLGNPIENWTPAKAT